MTKGFFGRLVNRMNDNSVAISSEKNLLKENVQNLRDSLSVKSLMGKRTRQPNRIKVRFFHTYAGTWNAMESLIAMYSQNDKYDVLVVIVAPEENKNRKIEQVERMGINYAILDEKLDDYNLVLDKPDISVISNPYFDCTIIGLRKNSRFIVVIPFTLLSYEALGVRYIDQFRNAYREIKPDAVFFDGLLFNYMERNGFDDFPMFRMGNLKYDEIYNSTLENDVPRKWSKLRGKRIVLYATTHGFIDAVATDQVAFDVYAKSLFKYFRENSDRMALIFRPHPTMIKELVECGAWSLNEVRSFRQSIDQSDNIIWDTSVSYFDAFSCCDAILTDVFCGIACSGLPLGHPVGVMYRNSDIKNTDQELCDILYKIQDTSDLLRFLDMIKNDQDEMKEYRNNHISDFVVSFDGNNGRRAYEKIQELSGF